MTTSSLRQLALADSAVDALLSEIRSEQWAAPTPCADWSVRDVVQHLVGLNLTFVALLEDGPLPERGTDRLGDDPADAFRTSAAALRAAFARPGILERSYPGPLGSATGAERLQIRLTDLLTHGWDLSKATGIPFDVPDEFAEQALAAVRLQLATQSRTGRFAEPLPIDDDAPALDRLAAFLGRVSDCNRLESGT